MYHRLPIGGIAAGAGFAAASGTPTIVQVGIALAAAGTLLLAVTLVGYFRSARRH